jgi:hypothetical protein
MLYQGTHAPLQGGLICQLANRARSFRQSLSTTAVDHVFAGVVAEPLPIMPANANGDAPAIEPLAALLADNGLSWNENVLGGIVL